MKLTTYKPELVTEKTFPGLLSCKFKHTVSKAEAALEYLGPQMSPDVWKEVLAFFQWTYDTTHSESQVRLFVNTKTRNWAAWAFPQEARTGMTARELDTPEKAKQRAQFADNEGWIYFGTVHHHCGMSAFQSGTDMANERDQDGLHITVGNMASNRYDLHARFYLGGFCFEPDLSKFWNVGKDIADLVPHDLWDRVARHQMTCKVPPNAQFPDAWKENLIEVKQTFPQPAYTSPTGYSPGYSGSSYTPWRENDVPVWQRARKAIAELVDEVVDGKEWTEQKLVNIIEELVMENTIFSKIAEVMEKHRVGLQAMWEEIPPSGELSTIIAIWGPDTEARKANRALLEEQNKTKQSKQAKNGKQGKEEKVEQEKEPDESTGAYMYGVE